MKKAQPAPKKARPKDPTTRFETLMAKTMKDWSVLETKKLATFERIGDKIARALDPPATKGDEKRKAAFLGKLEAFQAEALPIARAYLRDLAEHQKEAQAARKERLAYEKEHGHGKDYPTLAALARCKATPKCSSNGVRLGVPVPVADPVTGCDAYTAPELCPDLTTCGEHKQIVANVLSAVTVFPKVREVVREALDTLDSEEAAKAASPEGPGVTVAPEKAEPAP